MSWVGDRRPAWLCCMGLSSLVMCALSAGCKTSHAAPPRPDLSGVWDVTYDGFLDVELRLDDELQRVRIAREGGRVQLTTRGGPVSFDVDCGKEHLLCPQEIWPNELKLSNRAGDLDDEGSSFALSLSREGEGDCVLSDGSGLAAAVETSGSARDGNWQATALSRGRVTTVVSGACVGAQGEAAGRVHVALTSGFSAVRR